MHLSVRARIILITVAILFFAIGANTLAGSSALAREYSNALQLKAFVIGQSLKLQLDRLLDLGIAPEDLVGFEKQCQEIVDTYEDIAYAMVVDVDGKILFHNDPSQRGEIISDAAMLKAVKSAEDTVLIYSKQGEKYYDAIIPVWDSRGRHIGAVRIGFPTRLVTEKMEGLVAHYIGVALVSLGFAITLLVSALSVWVTKPLMKLVTVIQEIGREGTDSAKRVDIDSKDEMGQLASAFNQTISDLSESHEKIRKHTQELELKVEERTAELKATNEQLQYDIAERMRAEKELQKATDELEKQNTRLATLYRVGQMVNSTLETNAILGHLTHEAMLVTRATHGQVLVVREEASRFERCSQRGFSPEETERARTAPLPLDQGINGRAYATRQPVCVDDVQAESGYFPLIPTTRAELALPIIRNGQVLGNLDLQSPEAGAFCDVDLDYLNALADQAAIALENARLYDDLRRELAERARAEEQLQHYAARLERSNRELEEFAYVASHDLQEPLRKVQAFGDRLKTKYGQTLGDQGRDYLERMQNAAARMQTLINGLLTYSRVTTRAQPFVPVDLAQTAQEVMSDLEVRIQEVGGQVNVENLPRIEADPTQMRQLLQNLIANALKFHRQDQPPVVKVHAGNASPNGSCQIFVEDNGIGFDEKYLDRIFQVFQRLHGRSEYEGSGVGLATCRKIVERHGGTISARSAPGQGATFIVTLPLRQPQGEANHQ
jgi:signal transduction histidine kinase/methyl-accepting chemotaxis protein